MTPEEIIDRWDSPQFGTKIHPPGYKMGEAYNSVCGDSCQIFILEEDGVIVDAKHLTIGCTITCCCADILCEHLLGESPDFKINLFDKIGIPIGTNRRGCVLLPLKAFGEVK